MLGVLIQQGDGLGQRSTAKLQTRSAPAQPLGHFRPGNIDHRGSHRIQADHGALACRHECRNQI